jgi:hypothetical protein
VDKNKMMKNERLAFISYTLYFTLVLTVIVAAIVNFKLLAFFYEYPEQSYALLWIKTFVNKWVVLIVAIIGSFLIPGFTIHFANNYFKLIKKKFKKNKPAEATETIIETKPTDTEAPEISANIKTVAEKEAPAVEEKKEEVFNETDELPEGFALNEGKYEVKNVIEQSNHYILYLAFSVKRKRDVILKEFFIKDICKRKADNTVVGTGLQANLLDDFSLEFTDEISAIKGFMNKSLMRVNDVFDENGTSYYITRDLKGNPLKTIVEKDGKFDEEKLFNLANQLSSAVKEIHENDVLHLALNSDNIIINKKGDGVITNFGGVSRKLDHQINGKELKASTAFDAPESLSQDKTNDIRSDIYSLGAVLYLAASGNEPINSVDRIDEDIKPLEGIYQPFADAILKCLELSPDNRFQTIDEFIETIPEIKKEEK